MKRLIGVVAITLLMSMTLPTISMAGVKKGQRLYKKNFYKKCGFSGVMFARHYLQAEWEDIYESGKLPEESKNICPKLVIETIKAKWWKEIYAFSVKYAKDGVPPNGCND
jgi:hypothetical protein